MADFQINRRGLILGAALAAGAGNALAARPRRGGGGGGEWVEIGSRDVSLLVDQDRINVGARWGLFRHLQLRVRGNDILVNNLRINFENGESVEEPVRALIRQGTATRVIDFPGRGRYIDSIDLWYQRVPNFRGSARIVAWAQR